MFSNENKRKNNVFNVYNNVWKNDYLKSSLLIIIIMIFMMIMIVFQ